MEVYDLYDGTAELLPSGSDEYSLFDENNIEIWIVGGNVNPCVPSTYTCKDVSVVGSVEKYWFQVNDIEAVGAGIAWSDDWNYIDYEAELSYNNLIGNSVTKDMILIDAVPKTGVTFKYSDIPWYVSKVYLSFSVKLRRTAGDSGTTDAVGKIAYTEEDVIISSTVSTAPGVTFTPTDKVYQKAATSSFYY